jgi:hypothetical protein
MQNFQWIVFRFFSEANLVKDNNRYFFGLATISLIEVVIGLLKDCFDIVSGCVLRALNRVLSHFFKALEVLIVLPFFQIFGQNSQGE